MANKFNHLNVPDQWNHYWSRYPQGYTIMESLIAWVSQVDAMVDSQNGLALKVEDFDKLLEDFLAQYDTGLRTTVETTLAAWQASGFLDVLIAAALQTEMDNLAEQLTQKPSYDEVRKNTTSDPITLSELHTEVKTAMTGGAVPVVGLDAVGNENIKTNAVKIVNTDFIKGANLYNGTYTNTNLVNNAIGMNLTGIFTSVAEIKPGVTYKVKTVGTHNRFFVYLSNDMTQGSPSVSLIEENPSSGNKEFIFTNTSNYKYLWIMLHYDASNIAPAAELSITDGEELKISSTKVLKKQNYEVEKNHLSLDMQNLLNTFIESKILNYFNKSDVVNDTFITFDTGKTGVNTEYVASNYISLQPNTDYVINHFDQIAFYDINKQYISGLSGYQLGETTFKTPVNACFTRLSVRKTKIDTYMLEEGTLASPNYESYGTKISENMLSDQLKKSFVKTKTLQSIMSSLFNAPTTLNIKLIGDSITAGVGGTGYATDGEIIYDTYKVNTNGQCWANSIKTYFESKFNCVVKNWGVSGKMSQDLVDNISTLVQSDDDIIICMIGTNDRIDSADNSITKLYNNLLTIGDYVRGQGKEIIFMSAPPASVANENIDYTRRFHMEDTDTAIMVASDYFNMEYVSIYKAFLNYCDLKGISVDTLIPDGVHPNDAGYALMFNIVCDNLGIGRKRVGANW